MKRKAINQSLSTRHARRSLRSGEEGWALLGLLLALSVMSIFLVSSIAPNVKFQIQREKEDEMVYRGNQIAKAISRYYSGRNALVGLQIRVPPPYGYLTELKKLRDGITIGVRELKLIRASEMIDPMVGVEWEPVRAGDKRIFNFLQSYSAETTWVINRDYFIIAGQPQPKPVFGGDNTTPSGSTPPTGGQPGGQPGKKPNPDDPDADPDSDSDSDDDPLKDLFGSSGSQPGHSNMPIVGVAPKLKGQALRPYFGLKKYEEWVFMYVPPPNQPGSGTLLR